MNKRRFKYFPGLIVALLWLAMGAVHAQEAIAVDSSFTGSVIVPFQLQDAAHQFGDSAILAGNYRDQFKKADTYYFMLPEDTLGYWFSFSVENKYQQPHTILFWSSRKYCDKLQLWAQNSNGTTLVGGIGARYPYNSRFILSDGYYLPLTLQPGVTKFHLKAANEIGPMYLSLSLFSAQKFAEINRRQVLIFSAFLGIVAFSVLFAIQFFLQYRKPVYLAYLAYTAVMVFREASYQSLAITFAPSIHQQTVTYLLSVTFALFLRYFLKLWALSKWLDTVVKWYVLCMLLLLIGRSIGIALLWYQAVRIIFDIIIIGNALFSALTFYIIIKYFKIHARVKVMFYAYTPLLLSFLLNILVQSNLIPSFPVFQYFIIFSFMLEILVFTIFFGRQFRRMEKSRSVYELRLAAERQTMEAAVQAAEQRVKDRIARDLHDDMEASMSAIRMLSQIVQDQFADKVPEAAPLLKQIHQSVMTTQESASDLIWATRAHPDYLNDIADRLREYATQVLAAQGLQYLLDIPRRFPVIELDVATHRNIYLIFKEAINNALKHSDCKTKTIRLKIEDKYLILEVGDDGKGFDMAEKSQGNGLANMAERARDIGADLQISSVPGIGTTVRLQLSIGALKGDT